MSDCFFCRIYQEKTNIFYENKYWFARFNEFPVSPGHSLLIARRHASSLLDLTEGEWIYLKPTLTKTISIIEKTDYEGLYKKMLENPVKDSKRFCKQMLENPNLKNKPLGYSIEVNEGGIKARTISHLHIHIIPRYTKNI